MAAPVSLSQFITQAALKRIFHYNPETGAFTNLRPGVGGMRVKHGYLYLAIRGREFRAHRVAWFYMTGKEPPRIIDHENRRKLDNRWVNLRELTHAQNCANNDRVIGSRTGLVGVWAYRDRFQACISVKGKRKYLGVFATAEEASAAFRAASDARERGVLVSR